MLKFVSFLWPLLYPDALFGPVYVTIHVEICFIFEHHSAQKNLPSSVAFSIRFAKSAVSYRSVFLLGFWISVSGRGDRGKEKRVIFFSSRGKISPHFRYSAW